MAISRMSIYRAKKNPAACKASTLYEVAENAKTTMEELMGKRLYIAGIECDGFVLQDGFIYAYKTKLPALPAAPRLLFVYSLHGHLYVGKRRELREYDKVVGVVTLRMEILQGAYV